MNQKYMMCCLIAALMFAGCGTGETDSQQASDNHTDNTETADHTENTGTEQDAEKGEDIPGALWVTEPSMKLDAVINMESVPFILGAQIEYTGYPADWYRLDPAGTWDIPSYRSDAVIAQYQGGYGIMDYDGNVLFPFTVTGEQYEGWIPIRFQPFEGFIADLENGGARKFTADFTSTEYVLTGGVGGYAPTPYIVNGEILIDDLETMKAGRFENSFSKRLAVEITDKKRTPIGCAVVNEKTEIIAQTDAQCGQFINGFLGVQENADYENPGRKGFMRAGDGKEITNGPVYEDTMYFEDGYAPVKTNGLWAFIDEDGKAVTDPLFEDVSALNHGRAYVKYHGLWGILDLQLTAEKYELITDDVLNGDYQEEDLLIPESHEDEVIGTATVLVDNLNSRSIPSIGGEKKGKVKKTETYNVYDIYKDSEYTWYRIGKNRWIADNGKWVKYAAG